MKADIRVGEIYLIIKQHPRLIKGKLYRVIKINNGIVFVDKYKH